MKKATATFFAAIFSTFAAVAQVVPDAAAAANRRLPVPPEVSPVKSFDPVKAGWPLVFSDEFNGSSLDLDKWSPRSISGLDHVRVADGMLAIDVDRSKDGKELETGAIRTKQSFLYGYFEARLKFTQQNGWWAAFWLYADSVDNPFLDGFELDIFEDYYVRRRDAEGRSLATLDHNLHMYVNGTLKSWNYLETLKGSLDDFHVIGCKWTPFEISYYMDGELIKATARHSPWQSVTFDPFNHGVPAVPLYAILSGQIMRPEATWLRGLSDYSASVLPERFLVDWIRVYAFPDPPAERPLAAWDETYESGADVLVQEGERRTYRVKAAPASATGAAIDTVYLFDSGYLVERKSQPPFTFTVEASQSFYDGTDFMRPGRQKAKPSFDGVHALVAFVRDANGKISRTPPIEFTVVSESRKSSPFEGKAAAIPGKIDPARYDEGGQGVAYSDSSKGNSHGKAKNWRMDEDVDCNPGCVGAVGTGEWINYTVDVAEEGDYEMSFRYGTPAVKPQSMQVLLDMKRIATIKMHGQDRKYGWGGFCTARKVMHLPAGRHVLRLVLKGNYNFYTIEFKKVGG